MEERNYGIDFLRMLSMFMVIILHVFYQGGISDTLVETSLKAKIVSLLPTMACCAVNCYGLVSGYVGVNTRFRYSRIIKLWIQVAFYTLIITSVFNAFYPDGIYIKHWGEAIRPVACVQYWYFTAYFAMFFFVPFMNRLLDVLNRKELLCLGVSVILVVSVYQTLCPTEPLGTQRGYSFLWLCFLYLLGGTIRKTEDIFTKKKYVWLLFYLGGVITTWGWKYLTECLLPENQVSDKLLEYISPTTLLCGIALCMIFKEVGFSYTSKKIISFWAPLSFGVYLIHTHPLIYHGILHGAFVNLSILSAAQLILCILIICLGIYIVCSLVEFVRRCIFRWTGIDKLCNKIERKVDEYIKI